MALFVVDNPRIMEIDGLKFHTFHIEDKHIFDDIYFSVGYKSLVWENLFPHLYPFACSLKNGNVLLWKMVGKHMCVFMYNTKSKRMYLYCNIVSKNNEGNLREDMNKCVRILSKINKTKYKSVVDIILGTQLNYLFDKEFITKNNGEVFDYFDDFIFRRDDLINLEGKQYKARRHLVNRFKSTYPNHVIRYMNDNDYDQIMVVRENWIKSKFKKTSDVWDYEIFPHTLKNRKSLNVSITVSEIDGIIQGFFVMAKLGKDCSVVLNENNNLEYQGLSEYLWYESLRMNFDLGYYENDGNGGSPNDGVYKYKLSHRPVDFIKLRGITLNKKGEAVKKGVFNREEISYE